MKDVIWSNPPKACDLCKAQLKDSFFDARIPRYGQWGNVCPACFKSEKCGLGLGRGQRYVKQSDGQFHQAGYTLETVQS